LLHPYRSFHDEKQNLLFFSMNQKGILWGRRGLTGKNIDP